MVQLTVGYVAGFIAAAIFVGRCNFVLLPRTIERALTRNLQPDFGVQMFSHSFCLEFCETETVQLPGKVSPPQWPLPY